MTKLYLLIAGVLTGAGVGLIAGGGNAMAEWVAAGAVMGLVLAIAARPRAKQSNVPSLKGDS